MNTIEIIEKFGVVAYAVAIIFGGAYGLKYFKVFKASKHNFLLFASIFAVLFVLLEVAVKTFQWTDATKYLITYAVATVLYDTVLKKWLNPEGWEKDKKPTSNPQP